MDIITKSIIDLSDKEEDAISDCSMVIYDLYSLIEKDQSLVIRGLNNKTYIFHDKQQLIDLEDFLDSLISGNGEISIQKID